MYHYLLFILEKTLQAWKGKYHGHMLGQLQKSKR